MIDDSGPFTEQHLAALRAFIGEPRDWRRTWRKSQRRAITRERIARQHADNRAVRRAVRRAQTVARLIHQERAESFHYSQRLEFDDGVTREIVL